MLKQIFSNKKYLKAVGVTMAVVASSLLVWFTLTADEPGRNQVAVAMEQDSAAYFATERDFSAMAQDVRTGNARSIGLSSEYALVARADGSRYYVRTDAQRALVAEALKEKPAGTAPAVFALGNVQPPATPLGVIGRNLSPVLLTLLGPLLILFLILQMNPLRGMGGQFKTAVKPTTRFKDVIGVEEAKDALQDIVAYLKHPKKFADIGAKAPKGVVLEGHFGAGKTMLARAVAGEAGVPFIALSGADFSDMFLGVGVRRVKKLFELARKQSPCVIFIDEIDGLGKRSGGSSGAETENNRIINTLLVELDGFESGSGIVVLGATNNVNNLDPALIRPGRFNRTCHLGLPDVDEREALFRLYAKALRTAGEPGFRQLARMSAGLSPASIANAVNAAALLAAKEDAPAVTQEYFQRTLEQSLMGGPSSAGQSAMAPDERERIAVHEAGHAVLARLLEVGVVEKVSILKRGHALGVTLVTREHDATLQSETEVRNRMTMLLGGRGAEALMLKSASTGAANDLEHVSRMAFRMVTEFGFSSAIGPFSYAGLPEQERQGVHAEAIVEARQITKEVESRCAELLLAHRGALELLTAELLEHETVSGDVVQACLDADSTRAAGAHPAALLQEGNPRAIAA
ncbi:MAG: AAA family ATPase [Betaproteobacteria bacterium]